jgi:hypothetical protein
MDDFLYRLVLESLLMGALGLPLVLGNDNVLFAFADFFVGGCET